MAQPRSWSAATAGFHGRAVTSHFDAIVVGAGIAGASTAWFLLAEGLRVALVDTHAPGGGASGRNPGFLWLQTKAAGLSMALSLRARSFAEDFARDMGDASFRSCGGLILYRDPACKPVAQAFVVDRQAAGLPVSLLDRAEVANLVPEIGPEVSGAVWNPLDAHQNTSAFIVHLGQAFVAAGGTLMSGARVVSLDVTGSRCRGVTLACGRRLQAAQVVLATGPFCNDLLRPHGVTVPFSPVRLEAAATAPAPFRLGPVLAGQALFRFFVPPGVDSNLVPVDPTAQLWPDLGFTEQMASLPDGSILFGCAYQVGDSGDQATVAGQAIAISTLCRNVPALARLPLQRVWAGSVALTADSLPVVDPDCGVDCLALNLGHWYGNLAGALSGRMLTEAIMGRTGDPHLAALSRQRLLPAV